MIKTKKEVKYDASKPKEKAILVFSYGNRMALVDDKIEILINHFRADENGRLVQLNVNNPSVVMPLKDFNEVTKNHGLDIDQGWVNSLLNIDTITSIMIEQIGSNSDIFYGLSSKDLEPLNG